MEPLVLITTTDPGESRELGTALEVLRARASVEVCQATHPGELDGVLHRAGSRPIVVAGGDADLHAVIATLHRRNELSGRTLGLLPMGTATGSGHLFARRLGLPIDPVAAAAVLLTGAPRAMDLIVDELGGVVLRRVRAGTAVVTRPRGTTWKDRLPPLDRALHPLDWALHPIDTALAAIRTPSVRVRVEVDGTVVADMDRPIIMVAIGTARTSARQPATTEDQADGTDVLVAFAKSAPTRPGDLLGTLGRAFGPRDYRRLRGSRISVSGEDFSINADGVVTGPERRRTWHVEAAAYAMLGP